MEPPNAKEIASYKIVLKDLANYHPIPDQWMKCIVCNEPAQFLCCLSVEGTGLHFIANLEWRDAKAWVIVKPLREELGTDFECATCAEHYDQLHLPLDSDSPPHQGE